jgi:hypothetical protein
MKTPHLNRGTYMNDPSTLIDRQTLLGNYLVQGWPELAIPGIPAVSAAAAVGNASQENNAKSVTTGALDHGSNGLFQWRDSGSGSAARLSNMEAFGNKWFGTWQSIEAQAAFFSYECKGWFKSLWADLVAGTKSLDTLTANIMVEYEAPAAAYAMLDKRLGYAESFMKAWKPTSVPTTAIGPSLAPVVPVPTPQPTISQPPVIPPAPLGVTFTMDPALIAALAPIVESLAAGLFRALITQLSATTSGATPVATAPAAAPAVDLGSLVTSLAPLLAAEMAKLIPPAPAVKS